MKLTTAASVLAAAISMAAGAPAFASSLCTNTTNCTLTLNDSNVNGSGNYGTVNLQYDGSYGGYGEITITVNLAGTLGVDNPDNTYPGDFGFTDSLGTGGSLYIDDFNGDDPNHNYSGFTTGSEHFDGFGTFNIAAATNGPTSNGSNIVSFDVWQYGLNNVNQLLNLASPVGSDGAAYFVVNDHDQSQTSQLLAVTATTATPEPSSYAFILLGMVGIAFAYNRKSKLAQSAK
jgi:hypothetical protein